MEEDRYIVNALVRQALIASEEVRGYAKDRPRTESGRIEVDITKPHILEDMDFFREKALFYEEHGKYTNIPINSNPKSEYADSFVKR